MGRGAPRGASWAGGARCGLGGWLALSLHTTEQVIGAHAEHWQAREQLGQGLLCALLDLVRDAPRGLSTRRGVAPIPCRAWARLGDALPNDLVHCPWTSSSFVIQIRYMYHKSFINILIDKYLFVIMLYDK